MSFIIPINAWADIPRVISMMQQAGVGHRVPVMQALYHGHIAHCEMARTVPTARLKAWMAMVRLPALALIGDDDQASTDGPDTWRQAPRLFRWARFILIHGGNGEPEHYEYAVALTREYRRVVMVECSSANVQAWRDAAEQWAVGAKGQIMMPPPGVQHPAIGKGRMQ